MRNKKALFSSEYTEWETPQNLFDNLDKEFHFTLDVCATRENTKCSNYYTKEIDGLSQSWDNNICFMNPPYGKSISKWIEKAYQESLRGTTVVCLLPSRTDTSYQHKYIFPNFRALCFIRGRLKFGIAKNSAPFPSQIVVFSTHSLSLGQVGVLLKYGYIFQR